VAFVRRGLMAEIPWSLSQSELWKCIIQYSSFKELLKEHDQAHVSLEREFLFDFNSKISKILGFLTSFL